MSDLTSRFCRRPEFKAPVAWPELFPFIHSEHPAVTHNIRRLRNHSLQPFHVAFQRLAFRGPMQHPSGNSLRSKEATAPFAVAVSPSLT